MVLFKSRMYMPLTGFDKIYEKKRGVKVSVDSIGSVGGTGYSSPVAQKQEIAEPPAETTNTINNNSNDSNTSIQINTNNCYSSDSNKMSTEDFLSLRKAGQTEGSGTAAAMETIKDIMALKMLEKVLEAVTEIIK
jgi:hypothetical protein